MVFITKIYAPLVSLILLFSTNSFTLNAQLHTPPSCGTSFDLTWDSTPNLSDEFSWLPDGSLANTLENVGNSGVNFTFNFSGDTGTLDDWNGLGGPNTPGIGQNATGGLQDALEYFTNGFNSTGITLTLTFSSPVTEIGFDLFHVNGAGPNGDQYTITATNTLASTIYPTFTESATPSYTTNTTGVVDSDNNSTAGDNARVGVNFSDLSGITSITFVWDECSACTAGTAHGSGIGNMEFCANVPNPAPPYSRADYDTTNINQSVVIDVLVNDFDPNSNINPNSIAAVAGGNPANGSLAFNTSNGEITYTPASGFIGNDTFEYQICDLTTPTPLCDTATVYIHIILDSDGDGITDDVDLDDDNDGIYDSQEICGTDPNQVVNTATINVFIDLDEYENETSWTLTGPSGTVASGGTYADGDNIINQDIIVSASGTYTFTIFDSFGDGLNLNGNSDENAASSYQISLDGNIEFASAPSPDFGNDESHDIIVTLNDPTFSCLTGDPSKDNDNDGIPNYQDTDFCALNAMGVCDNMDSDGDGIINSMDLDADNDGIPDIIEAQGIDIDGNGQVDNFSDADGDGLTDQYDPMITTNIGWSTTGDCSGTTTSYNHNISLASGTTDVPTTIALTFCLTGDYGTAGTETITVTGEGSTNLGTFDKSDSDNTAYSDCVAQEFCISTTISSSNWNTWNDDGQVDFTFTPSVNVNFCTNYSCLGNVSATYPDTNTMNNKIPLPDTDGDNLADIFDLDSDNDGITDLVEAGGVDVNGDGFVDNLTDIDGDGFSDVYDPDNDGIAGIDAGDDDQPLVETDGSGNFLNGNTGNSIDTDGDGLPDHLDLDADNDGIPDLVEAGGIDINGDGRVDISTDLDNDGYADIYDSDDDGTLGIDDASDPLLITGGTDTNNNGHADDSAISYEDGNNISVDFDNDGIPDHLDLDADNDGIPDLVEAGAPDPDNNGMVDTGLLPWDADGDGLADAYDENAADGPGNPGANGTALIETSVDSNNDGKVNNGEQMLAGGSNNINADGTGNPNHLDLDADDDGITDVIENASGNPSADNGGSGALDGTVNNYDDSGNNDGWNDSSNSTTIDSDGDGLPDFLDIDADNDGIPDYREGVCSACPSAAGPSGTDTDGNGVLDIYENMSADNTDNSTGNNVGTTPHLDDDDLSDSTPDYLDTDTDEDTAMDWSEGYDLNNNGSALDDIITMAANYEAANGNPGDYPTTDSDADGIPDWMDNQPGVAGYNELSRPPFLDAGNAAWTDADNDGLVDLFDASEGGTNAPTPDNNSVDDADWRDNASQAFLPVELISFIGLAEGCNIRLSWSAESEETFDYYQLERSADGLKFSSIKRITGNGVRGQMAYQHLDEQAEAINFYRLKMVDLDGQFEYSEIISVYTQCDTERTLLVYPNPIMADMQYINVKWEGPNREETFVISDNLGRVLRKIPLSLDEGINNIRLDISNLSSGIYYLRVEGEQKSVKMFTIQE